MPKEYVPVGIKVLSIIMLFEGISGIANTLLLAGAKELFETAGFTGIISAQNTGLNSLAFFILVVGAFLSFFGKPYGWWVLFGWAGLKIVSYIISLIRGSHYALWDLAEISVWSMVLLYIVLNRRLKGLSKIKLIEQSDQKL